MREYAPLYRGQIKVGAGFYDFSVFFSPHIPRLFVPGLQQTPPNEWGTPLDERQISWGKARWHLRVGFYALDSILGLGASVVTATLFTYVAKVCM